MVIIPRHFTHTWLTSRRAQIYNLQRWYQLDISNYAAAPCDCARSSIYPSNEREWILIAPLIFDRPIICNTLCRYVYMACPSGEEETRCLRWPWVFRGAVMVVTQMYSIQCTPSAHKRYSGTRIAAGKWTVSKQCRWKARKTHVDKFRCRSDE